MAAYAIGVAIYEGAFGRTYKFVRPCLEPRQTGCIVSWNSYLADADTAVFLQYAQQPYVTRYGDGPGKTLFCINPLTFDAARPSAPAAANDGSLPWPPSPGPLTALVPHAVGAECRNGVLMVTPSPTGDFKPFALPGGSLHMQDTDLFYAAIRRNAVLRVQSYLKR